MNEVYSKDLGIVTAYGYALSKGYTGTEEQFATLMADYATIGQQAVDAALAAEGYAVGTHDGEPVSSDDPAYENNAKYYAEQIEAESESFARIDGSYDSMTVGNAEQLISTISTEDSVPYVFRTSGGAADIGDREQDTITGGTVNWNQLMQNGNFASTSGWSAQGGSLAVADNICTLTPSASAQPSSAVTIRHNIVGMAPVNHVYMAFGTIKPAAITSRLTIRLYNNTAQTYIKQRDYTGSFTANVSLTISVIGKPDVDVADGQFRFYIGGNAEGGSYDVTNINVFDLTAMFGTAIADYIYSVEQATAGAGVALAKRWGNIIKPYYPYQANGLVSVEGLQSHDMVGFNQWDEVWELGNINTTTGQDSSSSNRIRTKNYISVISDAAYYVKASAPINVFYYDADKNYISAEYVSLAGTHLFTALSNAKYIRCTFGNGDVPVTTYNHDICINISHDGSRNGEYEPYELRSYPLDSSLTLRGIPKLNAANELYYDGDRYLPDGTVERRYGIVDLGSLTWTMGGDSGTYFFYASIADKKIGIAGANDNILCSKYETTNTNYNGNTMPDKSVKGASTLPRVYAKDLSYSSAADFKTAMSGVYLVYELATPTTESATPYAENQYVSDWGVEEYVISSEADYIAPVGHATKYPSNLRDKLQHLPSLSANGDGTYAITQTGSQMSLTPLPAVIPALPSENGTYVLKATVTSGAATLSWVAE